MEHSDHATDIDVATLPQPSSLPSDISSATPAAIGEVTNLIVASWQQGGTTVYSPDDGERVVNSAEANKQQTSSVRFADKVGNAFIGDYITRGLKVGANEPAIQATESLAAQVMGVSIEETFGKPREGNEKSFCNLVMQPGISSPFQQRQFSPKSTKKGLQSPCAEIVIKHTEAGIQFKLHVDALNAKGLNAAIQLIAKGPFGALSKSKPVIETYDGTAEGDISRIIFKNRDAVKIFLKELHNVINVPVNTLRDTDCSDSPVSGELHHDEEMDIPRNITPGHSGQPRKADNIQAEHVSFQGEIRQVNTLVASNVYILSKIASSDRNLPLGTFWSKAGSDSEHAAKENPTKQIKNASILDPLRISHAFLSYYNVDRTKALSTLEKYLGTCSNQTVPYFAITGLSGSGKTVLAKQFIQKRKNLYKYRFFIRCEDKVSLLSDYRLLAKEFNIIEDPKVSEENFIAMVHMHLSSLKNFIIIFDNANKDFISEYLNNNLPEGGHILITSQSTYWKDSIDLTEEEYQLTSQEAIETLVKYKSPSNKLNENELVYAKKIIDILHNFPMAISQAGAYIAQNKLSYAKFLDEFNNLYKKMEILKWPPDFADKMKKNILIGWKMAITAINKRLKNDYTENFLNVCAFLEADCIPHFIFEFVPEHKRHKIILALKDYSLIRMNNADHPETLSYSIHRLLQEVLRDNLKYKNSEKEEYGKFILHAVNLIDSKFTYNVTEVNSWFINNALPHIVRLSSYAEYLPAANEQLFNLLNSAALQFNLNSQFKSALTCLQKAYAYTKNDTFKKGVYFYSLSKIYNAQANFSESEEAAKKALKKFTKCFKSHPDLSIGHTYNNIGLAQMRQNNNKAADVNLRKAVEISTQLNAIEQNKKNYFYKLEGDLGARSYMNLAHVCKNLKKFEEALEYTEKAIESNKKDLPDLNHPNIAYILNIQGEIYLDKNEKLKAADLFKQALQIYEKIYQNKKMPRTAARIYKNLAITYSNLNNTKEAYAFAKKTVDLCGELFPDQTHPFVKAVSSILQTFHMMVAANKESVNFSV